VIENGILGSFWECFPRGKPIYGLPRNRALTCRACWSSWRASAEQHLLFCTLWPFGVFPDIYKCSFCVFLYCFDNFNLSNHVYMELIEICCFEMNFDIIWMWFWNEIEVRFFSNEIMLLCLNHWLWNQVTKTNFCFSINWFMLSRSLQS